MESIGQFIVVTAIETLHNYFIDTFTSISSSYYSLASMIVTLYVIVIGYMAATGKLKTSIQQLAAMVICIPITFLLFFNPIIFTDWIYQPLFSTMAGLMSLVLGSDTFTLSSIFQPIDDSFSKIFEAVDGVTNQMDTWDLGMKVKVFFVSGVLGLVYAILYTVFTVLIVTAIFAIHVLLVLGPIFGVFAAFKVTRSYFFSWLKAIITYALVPVFTAIVMGITLQFLKIAIQDITDINVVETGIFTQAIGSSLLIGVLSISLHLKASEFASALTGGQISGLSGFFGTVAGIGVGATQLGRLTGANKLIGSSISQARGKTIGMTMNAGKRAYSRLRGFVN